MVTGEQSKKAKSREAVQGSGELPQRKKKKEKQEESINKKGR